jgi:hypothetical protein
MEYLVRLARFERATFGSGDGPEAFSLLWSVSVCPCLSITSRELIQFPFSLFFPELLIFIDENASAP